MTDKSKSDQANSSKPKREKIKRSWKQRLLRWSGYLLILVVIGRVVLSFAMPSILDAAVANMGMAVRYERLNLSLLSGSCELWHLYLHDKQADEEQEPLVHLEYAAIDLDTLALLTGNLVLRRVELDGVDVLLDRAADGSSNFSRLQPEVDSEPEDSEPEDSEPPESEPSAEEPQAVDLGLSLQLISLRAQHLRLHLRDASVQPTFDGMVDGSLRLSDLGSPLRPARLQLALHCPDVLDSFRIEAQGKSEGRELQAELSAQLAGFHPQAMAGLLQSMGIEPAADEINLNLHATVQASPVADDELNCQAELSIHDVQLSADGQEAVALDKLAVQVDRYGPLAALLSTVHIEGLRANLEKLPSGASRVAGLDFLPSPAGAAPASVSDPAPTPAAAAPAPAARPEANTDFDFALQELRLSKGRLTMLDRSVQPAANLVVTLDDIALRDLRSLKAKLSLPGVIEQLQLDGQLDLAGVNQSFDVQLAAHDLNARELQSYLKGMGLQATFQEGSLTCKLRGSMSELATGGMQADLQLRDLELREGEQVCELPLLAVQGLRLDPSADLVRVERLLVQGPKLTVQRHQDGALHVPGFKTVPASTNAVSPQAATSAGPSAAVPAPVAQQAVATSATRVQLGVLEWEGLELQFLDPHVQPAVDLPLQDFSLQLRGFSLGGKPGDPATAPAQLKLSAHVPQLLRDLEFAGQVVSKPGPLDLQAEFKLLADGLNLDALQAYLQAGGLDSQLQEGRLGLDLSLSLQQQADALHADLACEQLRFQDGEQELLALPLLQVQGARLHGQGIHLGNIQIQGPLMTVQRDEHGLLQACGLRQRPAAKQNLTRETAAETSAEPEPEPEPVAVVQTGSAPAPIISMHHFQMQGVTLNWQGHAVKSKLELGLEVQEFVFTDKEAKPAKFELQLQVTESLQSLKWLGSLQTGTEQFVLDSSLHARGLRAGPLQKYMPAGCRLLLQDGRFDLTCKAEVASNDAGGKRALIQISKLNFQDGEDGPSLLAMDSLLLSAPRIDLDGGQILIDEVSTSGLQLAAWQGPGGSMQLLGLELSQPAEPENKAQPAGEQPAVAQPTVTQPAVEQPGVAQPAAPTTKPGEKPIKDRHLPTVRLNKLNLAMECTLHDLTQEDAEPLKAHIALANPQPLVLLNSEPTELPPFEFQLTASAAPLLDRLQIDLQCAPFIGQPELQLSCVAQGIHGDRIQQWNPALAKALDGAAVTDGQFSCKLESNLRLRRRSALDFNMADGFGLEATLSNLEYRAQPDGEILLGLEAAYVDVKKMDPATGDLHIKTISLTKPQGRVQMTNEGMQVLGLTLLATPDQPAAESSATELPQSGQPEAANSPVADVQVVEASMSKSKPAELRVDELLVEGIDFQYLDTSVDPPMLLPLEGLDIEIKKFTSRSLTEPIPLRFGLALNAGLVGMPEDLAQEARVRLSPDKMQRPLFDELAVSGRLKLFPKPTGWVKVNLSALELVGLRGMANSAMVEIGNGVLDFGTILNFQQDGDVDVDANIIFTDLSMDEPAGGPISRYLKLPAPLDQVLFLLRNEDGEHRIPLSFGLSDGGISAAEIAQVSVSTFGQILAKAIAASPFRVVGGLGSLAGLGGDGVRDFSGDIVALEFAPADASLTKAEQARLRPLVDLLYDQEDLVVVLQHEFSMADLQRGAILANPSEDSCKDLAMQLRHKKASMLRKRDALASEVRTLLVIGQSEAAEQATQRLRAMDSELGKTEDALDQIHDLLSSGAYRRQGKRTKTTCLSFAQLRLQAAHQALLRSGISDAENRVELRRPRFSSVLVEPEAAGRVLLTPKMRTVQ